MSSMSYLACEQQPYWRALQSEGSNGSAAMLVRQQRMTLQIQTTMDALVGDQESIVRDIAAKPSPSLAGYGTFSTYQVPRS